MNSTRLILNTSGWVYLRSTIYDNIFKIGRSSADGLRRASIKKSKIIRLNMSLNNHQIERHLINAFNEKYILYGGNEYFMGDMFDMIKTFDEVFANHEKIIYNNLMVSNPPSKSAVKRLNEEDAESNEDINEAEGEFLGRLRKRKRIM